MLVSNLLFEPDPRVLKQQCQLILQNAAGQFLPSLFAFTLLFGLTLNRKNAAILTTWFICTLTILCYSNYLIRRTLNRGIDAKNVKSLSERIIASSFLFSLHWLSYLWITLDNLNLFSTYIALAANIALMALYLGTNVGVYLAYLLHGVVTQVGLSLKLTLMGEIYSKNTWFFTVAILTFFLFIAFKQNRVNRKTIALEIENQALIQNLADQNKNLEKAQQLAEDANQAKSRFLAAASHDIRQPIHALGLFLDVLLHSQPTTHQSRILQSATKSFGAAIEMLDTLLDFSRLESGTTKTNCQYFHLQTLIDKLETEFTPQIIDKDLALRIRDNNYVVFSDPFLLELILRNLIGNAIRYTNNGGILIGVRKRSQTLSLEIWDTGIGIPYSHQTDIFREFYRIHRENGEQRQGLGLGLAIAQGFAKLLGHEITFNSHFKRGSVFRIQMNHRDNAEHLIEQITTLTTQSIALKGNILVIEDDENVRLGMEHLLRSWGCEYKIAINIEDALSYAALTQPNIIISDYTLSEPGNGIEAIQLLRSRTGSMVPAVIISGDTSQELLRQTETNNIVFFSKPVHVDLLYQHLEKILRENYEKYNSNKQLLSRD